MYRYDRMSVALWFDETTLRDFQSVDKDGFRVKSKVICDEEASGDYFHFR